MSTYYVATHYRPANAHLTVEVTEAEPNEPLARTVWRVEGEYITSPDIAVASLLTHLSDVWAGTGPTYTRLVPREPTNEEKLEAARRILRADYWDDVRSVASDITAEIESGELTDREEVYERLDELVDGSHRVNYTYSAMEGVMASDNDGAYEQEFGSDGMVEDGQIQWSRLCWAAMRQDVLDRLGDVEDLIDEHKPLRCDECAKIVAEDDANYTEDDDETPYCDTCFAALTEEEGDDADDS